MKAKTTLKSQIKGVLKLDGPVISLLTAMSATMLALAYNDHSAGNLSDYTMHMQGAAITAIWALGFIASDARFVAKQER